MLENYSLSQFLQEVLTLTEFIELTEKFGGRSLYIAKNPDKISHDLTLSLKQKLIENFAGIAITVPLARHVRAQYYLEKGFSKRSIAVRLGMTESSVRRVLKGQSKANRSTSNDHNLPIIDFINAQKH